MTGDDCRTAILATFRGEANGVPTIHGCLVDLTSGTLETSWRYGIDWQVSRGSELATVSIDGGPALSHFKHLILLGADSKRMARALGRGGQRVFDGDRFLELVAPVAASQWRRDGRFAEWRSGSRDQASMSATIESWLLLARAAYQRIMELPEAQIYQLMRYASDAGSDLEDLLAIFPRGNSETVGVDPQNGNRTLPETSERGRPSGSTDDVLNEVFAEAGLLSESIPDYDVRPAQIEMASLIDATMRDQGTLLVEAGTGVGKSLAYLIPAISRARKYGERTIISTNTRNLQQQLWTKDLPIALAGSSRGGGVRAVIVSTLKGRSNYVCARAWHDLLRTPCTDPAEALERLRVGFWLLETDTGDKAEIDLDVGGSKLFDRISSSNEVCFSAGCDARVRESCWLFKARRRALESDIVIVNHALLIQDALDGGGFLGQVDNLVIDEAHHLEAVATGQCTESWSVTHILEVFHDLGGDSDGERPGLLAPSLQWLASASLLVDSVEDARTAATFLADIERLISSAVSRVHDFFEEIDRVCDALRGEIEERDAVRITPALRKQRNWDHVEIAWESLDHACAAIDERVSWLQAKLHRSESMSPHSNGETHLVTAVSAWQLRFQQLVDFLSVVSLGSDDNAIYWINTATIGRDLALHKAPLRTDAILGPICDGLEKSVTLTSATMTAGGRFDHMKSQIGVKDATESILPPPFDLEQSLLLALSGDMPEPGVAGHDDALRGAVVDLVRAIGGRSLVLFTSYRAMNTTWDLVANELADHEIDVIVQGMHGDAHTLAERLRANPRSVVFGTSSLWEGVDIQGPALSAVVITRLPFDVPTNPIFAARAELFDDPFHGYAIPRAVLRFRQGFGRLIRSKNDRGVVAVLDSRITRRAYGRLFTSSLPSCTVAICETGQLGERANRWLRLDA